jgi:hypothetical protein
VACRFHICTTRQKDEAEDYMIGILNSTAFYKRSHKSIVDYVWSAGCHDLGDEIKAPITDCWKG